MPLARWSGFYRFYQNPSKGRVVQSWVKITQGKCEIWNQISKLKKQIQLNSFLSTIWWLSTLKRIEKLAKENTFDEKEKRRGEKFNPGLALIGLLTTGPSNKRRCSFVLHDTDPRKIWLGSVTERSTPTRQTQNRDIVKLRHCFRWLLHCSNIITCVALKSSLQIVSCFQIHL